MYLWSCVILGNQASIFKDKILPLGNSVFTLVLVVGEQNLYQSVSSEIIKKFQPHGNHIFLPIVLHFQKDHVKGINGCEWAHKCEVDKKIKDFLKNGKSFVFYRNNGIADVRESAMWNEAVTKILEICI